MPFFIKTLEQFVALNEIKALTVLIQKKKNNVRLGNFSQT